MLEAGLSALLIALDQGVRRLAIARGWPLATGGHLIHLPGQELAVILLGLIIYILSGKRSSFSFVPLAAGILSNLVSSLQAHGVIDYIPFGPFYTNSADLLITGGAIWYVLTLLRRRDQ